MRAHIAAALILVVSSSAYAQVVDRCPSRLEGGATSLRQVEAERDALRASLDLTPVEAHVLEGSCAEQLADVTAASESLRLEVVELRERQRIRAAKAKAAAPPAASVRAQAQGPTDVRLLREEVARLKEEARIDRVRARAPAIDIPTVQLGVVLSSLGGSFVLSSVLSTVAGAGLFILGGSTGLDEMQLSGGLTVGGALALGAVGGVLLYFGADRLADGLRGGALAPTEVR